MDHDYSRLVAWVVKILFESPLGLTPLEMCKIVSDSLVRPTASAGRYNYHRRILTQLNRGEGRHRLARAIFHERKGEIRQSYHEGQEDQLSTLGLVVNVIVLWNTVYMGQAVRSLRTGGSEVKAEDVS